MVRTKVFVGNLSFKTQERDLAKEFEAAGKVASANIITRGSRSLGYGFVEMESEEDANKAVQLLNKKTIDQREINVEVAKPREETPQDANGASQPRAPRRRRNPGLGGQKRFRARKPQGGADGTSPAAAGEGGAPAPAATGAPAGGRRPRAPRPPRTNVERGPRTPSNSTLFVTNLPFSMDDTGLTNLFAGLSIKTAHVVRKRNNRSKGFGFVEFDSQDDQQKALAAMDKKEVEGREIVVKVALTEDKSAAPKADAPAAAPAADKKN